MAGFGRCFTRNRGAKGRLIRLCPTKEATLSSGATTDVGGPGVLAGPGACSPGVLTRQRKLPFLHLLPTLVEDLLDIVGRSYDGIDYVVLHDIHETMLDPGESDHPLAAVVVAQTPRDVAANFYLHPGLAEVDIAVTAQS